MRLWHEEIIQKLPRQQLLGQHRECCALRGKGWGKPHSVVNYIFKYDLSKLYDYHIKVMEEMMNRGYNVTSEWIEPNYRGKIVGFDNSFTYRNATYDGNIYKEHDNNYIKECVLNLANKGIKIEKL